MRRMVLAAAALLALVSAAGAQLSMPGRTITLVVTVAAGGGTDAMARIIAEQLQERLKQPVVVENRVGGGGTLGVSSVARAAPDGQTLLFLATSAAISKWLYKNVPFDVVADFAYVARAVTMPVLLVAHPSVPANDVEGVDRLCQGPPGPIVGRDARRRLAASSRGGDDERVCGHRPDACALSGNRARPERSAWRSDFACCGRRRRR